MPTSLPVPTKNPGDVLTSALWNSNIRDNINKLLNQGHRVLTIAQFTALTGLEGTKGVVAPDEVYLEVDATNGIQWHLAYESGETTYKWRYLGGPELSTEVTTSETTASTTYAALATAGPAVVLSRAGDYDVEHGALIVPGGNITSTMSYDIGATGAVDADSVSVTAPAASGGASVSRPRRKAAIAASTTLTAKYKTSAGTVPFSNRWMRVRPVRLV